MDDFLEADFSPGVNYRVARRAGTMQLLDAGIGLFEHDLGKCAGPLFIAVLQFFVVSASQIRADHAANQARIAARYGPALPSSPQLRGEADAAHHSGRAVVGTLAGAAIRGRLAKALGKRLACSAARDVVAIVISIVALTRF
jgi:hypothetical protein